MNRAQTLKITPSYLIPICLIATLGGFLFGYDTGVISGTIEPLTAKFALAGPMKGWVSGCVLIGCAFGVLIAGPVSDGWGRKKSLFLAAILFLLSAIGTAFSPSMACLVAFRVLGGFGIGVASISTPMYISEMTPAQFRGRLVAANQIAIVTGLTVVYFTNYAIARCGDQAWNNETGWRWMFASGLLPAALFAALLIRIPESPRWLIERKRENEARAILARIAGIEFARVETKNIRNALGQEQGNWKQLFSRKLAAPLIIGILLAVLQQVTGINVFMYFGTTLFRNISQSSGVDAGMIQQSLIGIAGILFTVIAIGVIDKWGRKPLMFIGTAGMFISLNAMGVMAQTMKDPAAAGMIMLLCIILYLGCFSLSAGPVIWVILSEIFPTAVRGRAFGLAALCMWLADYAVTQTFPMMDNNNWLVGKFNHAFPFYVYAVFCLVLMAVMCFVAETKGKSLEEIEKSWDHRLEREPAQPAEAR